MGLLSAPRATFRHWPFPRSHYDTIKELRAFEPLGDILPILNTSTPVVPQSIPRGRKGSAIFCVLTIVEDESDVAREVFEAQYNIAGSPYFVPRESLSGDYEVVIRRANDRGNMSAAEAIKDFLEHFRPVFILLIGIAGGNSQVDEVSKGDVVVADFVDYSEYSKLSHGKHLSRKLPYDQPSIYLRESFVEPFRNKHEWHRFIKVERPDRTAVMPKLIIGNIVAGEKLLSDPESTYQKEILAKFDKAVAVDMESFGVARTVFNARRSVHYNPQYLVIRGISDLVDVVDEENDDERRIWRRYACSTASAFGKFLVDAFLACDGSLAQREEPATKRTTWQILWRKCASSISDWLSRQANR